MAKGRQMLIDNKFPMFQVYGIVFNDSIRWMCDFKWHDAILHKF